MFPFWTVFHFSPQVAVLVRTPCLQSHQPLSPSLVVAAAVAAAAVVAAAVAQDQASVPESLMDSTQTQPTRTTFMNAAREKPTTSTVLLGWCSISAASAATGLK